MISIIIPTKNEETLLPRILADISKQTFKDYEVIVADADSDDDTVKIAESYGCKVVEGGMPGPGRNKGVEASRGEYLMFFDADVTFDEDFIAQAFEEFQRKYLEAASCYIYPDDLSDKDYKPMFDFYNVYVSSAQFFNPGALGSFIMCTRRLFDRLGGFDERIKLGEDYDFVKRASKISKFRIMNNMHVKISTRRIDKEGVLKYLTRNLSSEIYRFFVGEITEDIFDYEFANYDMSKKEKDKAMREKKKLKSLGNRIKSIMEKERRKKEYKQRNKKIRRRINKQK